MNEITQAEFEILCSIGIRYEGYVQGIGYVYWKPCTVISPWSGQISQTPYNCWNDANFSNSFFEMKVKTDMPEFKKKLEEVKNSWRSMNDSQRITTIVEALRNAEESVDLKKLFFDWPQGSGGVTLMGEMIINTDTIPIFMNFGLYGAQTDAIIHCYGSQDGTANHKGKAKVRINGYIKEGLFYKYNYPAKTPYNEKATVKKTILQIQVRSDKSTIWYDYVNRKK